MLNACSKGGNDAATGVDGGGVIKKRFIQCTIFIQNMLGIFLNKTGHSGKIQGIRFMKSCG